MGKRIQLKKHLHALGEVRDIMTAMKNLSLIELKKIARFISAQEKASADLENAVSDFLSFYPASAFFEEKKRERVPYLLVGSEHGFCGGFNEALMQKLEETTQGHPQGFPPALVLVGKKLASKFQEDPRVIQTGVGPTNGDEVPRVITELVRNLTEMGKSLPELRLRFLTVIYNQEEKVGFETKTARPFAGFFQEAERRYNFPPLLNLNSTEFFDQLTDHYLFSKLHEIFYFSLLAEHRQRLQHMEGAVQYLDKEISRLTLRMNEMRQEEITEEIEVILLGTKLTSEFQ